MLRVLRPIAPAFTIILVCAVTLTGCGLDWLFDSDSEMGAGRTESVEVVGADGVTLALDGVSVSGAAGVAPAGTTVQARLIEPDLPGEVGGFSDPVGNGVEITLGDGLQPASPLAITFAPDVVSEWNSAANADSDLLPVVFASKADGLGVELADAQLLPDGSVVVTADHLSWFQPVLASISGFKDWFDEQLFIFMQLRSERPDCVDQRAEDLGWEFSAVPHQLIWPCADETGGGLEVTFTNNSPEVWLLESDQGTPYLPIASSFTGMLVAALAKQGVDPTTTAPLVPPDGNVAFQVQDLEGPIRFVASLDVPMTVANAFVSVLSVVLPSKKLEALGQADCFLDLLATGPTASDKIESAAYGGLSGTIIRCVGSLVGGLGGILISAVAAIPGALTTLADGVVLELTGSSEFTITLSRLGERPDAPARSVSPAAHEDDSSSPVTGWPSDRNDGPSSLFIWLGANMYGFPDWVACDDATDYCLVGYPGASHVLIQISGLIVIGEVDDAAPDPRGALLALGLPDQIVTQILGQ